MFAARHSGANEQRFRIILILSDAVSTFISFMKLDGGCPAQPRHCCVGLQAEDLDQQHGSRGPKRDNQSRHYAAESVEVIVVIRLIAAVGLR